MSDDTPVISVKINPQQYLFVLTQKLGGHFSDLRVALRSLEDGSFAEKAAKSRPGSLLDIMFEKLAPHDEAVKRLCNRCFINLVGELITFLDRMIALQSFVSKSVQLPSVTNIDELKAIVTERLEEEYRMVSTDTKLSNPVKLAKFSGIDSFAQECALSYFAIRRAIEHHGGHNLNELTMKYMRLKLLAGEMEITYTGQHAPPNTGISLRADHVSRSIAARSDVILTEEELEHIVFTINNLIAPEIQRVVAVSLDSKQS